jgi:hypothetical protein
MGRTLFAPAFWVRVDNVVLGCGIYRNDEGESAAGPAARPQAASAEPSWPRLTAA